MLLRLFREHFFFSIAKIVNLLAHLFVDRSELLVKISKDFFLGLISNIFGHAALESLHDGLGLEEIATTSHVHSSLLIVECKHFVISLFFNNLSFIADFLLLGDYSQAL